MNETAADRALSALHHFYCVTLGQKDSYLDRKVVEPLKSRYIAIRYSKGR